MKQFASIFLLLLMLKLSAIGQSRILTGTLTSKPNTSTTILPYIVQTKTPDAQKEDSALFNPRYVPPPPVDSSVFNTNIVNNNQGKNVGTVESNYQYKTPDAQPVLDVNTTKAYTPVWHPKKKRTAVYNTKYVSAKKDYNQTATAIVSDPNELAAAENYGNATGTTKTSPAVTSHNYSKWKPVKKVQSTSVPTIQQQTYTPPAQETNYNAATTITPAIRMRTNSNPTVVKTSTPIVSNTATQPQPQQTENVNVANKGDYKVNLTTDGKYTVTFFNNGSSINVTQFGRIAGVTSPASGTNTASQYDYRGMLQSVGSLPLQYTYEGRLQSVGNTTLGYNYNGNIESIGGTPLSYNYNGTIDKIGNTKVLYDANNNVSGTSNNNPTIVLKTN